MAYLTMRYDRIVAQSCVDGPGLRTVLFVQGCPIECPGCQNRRLWPETGGQELPATCLAIDLLNTAMQAQGWPPTPRITISGGEPFAQARSLAYLVAVLKAYGAHIIVYSGYTWEDLLAMAEGLPEIWQVLERIDVLVDGPYERELDWPGMQYRGSANQRVIDVRASLSPDPHPRPLPQGERGVRGGEEIGEPVVLDWDAPEVVITLEGNLLGAAPVMEMFAEMGNARATRRCGVATDG